MINPPDMPNSVQLFKQRFVENFKNNKVSHALLFTDYTGHLDELIVFLTTTLLCAKALPACKICQSCQLVVAKEHPDFFQITPDKAGGVIKIDQIRELHEKIYKTPLISKNRVIIINPLEKLNPAGANALLKTLEEPPPNTFFLLTVQSTFNIPATILSRCQQWHFSSLNADFQYPLNQHELKPVLDSIVSDLEGIVLNSTSPLLVATRWSQHNFTSLISLLYFINTQLIRLSLKSITATSPLDKQLENLAARVKAVKLFKQLDKINSIIKDIHHNVNINSQLTLEILLLGYP